MECLFAKMLPLEQKQTVRQMSLMGTTCTGKLVWFSWYQRNSCVVCLHNPGGGGSWLQALAGTGGFAADTVFPLLLKSLCIIRCPENQVKRLIVRLLFIRRQPSAQRVTAAGVFSAHGTGWWTENTAGAGHCNVLQCSSLCYTHPLLSILALPLTIAQSVPPLSLFPSFKRSRICPVFKSLLYSSCFSHHVESPSHP